MKCLISMLSMAAILGALPATAGDEPDEVPVMTNNQDTPSAEPPGPLPTQVQTSTGQWVYTSEYGWVWMPYDNGYTYTPPDGSTPNMYVYGPNFGWCWVVAPWLWGWGPEPFFGAIGPRRYGWYGHGLGRWYGYQGRYSHLGPVGRAYAGGPRAGVNRSYGSTFGGGSQIGSIERGGFRSGSIERGGFRSGPVEPGGFRSGPIVRGGGFHGGVPLRRP